MLDLFGPLLARLIGDRFQDARRPKQRIPWRSVAEVSGRLNQVIKLASGPNRDESAVLAYLVELNPELSLTELEEARVGTKEPSSEIITKICESLGASYQFIRHGTETPFHPREGDHVPIRQYLGLFSEDGVETIWFVRANEYPHTSFIVIKYNEFKFRVLPHEFHVSAENGSGGASSLSELARLTEALQKARLDAVATSGLEIDSLIAKPILHGQLHASEIFRKSSKRSYWWEDLADVEHKRHCAKDYKNLYDKEFFNAQRIIAWAREGK